MYSNIFCDELQAGFYLQNLINRPWQSHPAEKGKGVVAKIDLAMMVIFFGPNVTSGTPF